MVGTAIGIGVTIGPHASHIRESLKYKCAPSVPLNDQRDLGSSEPVSRRSTVLALLAIPLTSASYPESMDDLLVIRYHQFSLAGL